MRYLLLVCSDESDPATEDDAVIARYGQFYTAMQQRGVLLTGERLRPTTTATTVRLRDGKLVTTDGPFAETKEQIGGYFVVDCRDLAEATEVAAQLPAAAYGTIEVRPIWEM
jgi:hypothetical protein